MVCANAKAKTCIVLPAQENASRKLDESAKLTGKLNDVLVTEALQHAGEEGLNIGCYM